MNRNIHEIRLAIGFATALSMLLLAGWQMYRSLESSIETSRWVSHTYEVLDTLAEVTAGINGIESGQRAFIITGDDYYLNERERDVVRIKDALSKLKRLTVDNPRQQLRIAKLDILAMDRLRVLETALELYGAQGFEAVRRRINSGASRPGMEALQKGADVVEEEERSLLAERGLENESNTRRTQLVGTALAAAALAVILLMWWWIRHEARRRHAAETAVRDSQTALQQILDLLPVGVFVCDAAGQITSINPAGKEIWAGERYVGLELYGDYQSWWTDSGKPIALEERALVRTLKTGETIRNELNDIQGFDGSRKTILNNTMPIRNLQGQVTGAVAVNQDVTEFKRTERKLRTAARFDETQSQALALFSTSFDRRKIFDGLLALLARNHPFPVSALYAFDEWNGSFHREATYGLAAEVAQEFALGEGLLGQAAQAGKTIRLETAGLVLQTGLADFIPAEVLMIPIGYQENRLAVLVLAASKLLGEKDHSFLELLASQLGVALHNLKQYGDLKLLAEQLRSRNDEIARKNQQLEEASRMKSEFLANMSHELRTPMNAVIGFAEVLKDGLMGEMTPQQKDCVVDIFDSGSHLLALINDILDLSKVEAGKMVLNLEPKSVPAIARASLQVVREMAMAHSLHLTSEVTDDLGEVWLDERKVKQILHNLLSNAVKFTPEGGEVHLTVRKVDRGSVPDGHFDHYLELAVKDTGIGIAAADQARLFQPFMQIDSTLSRRYEGTGLGLVMVRHLAELHDGAVTLKSEIGQGSTFTVWLPWRTEGEKPVEAAKITRSPSLRQMAPAPVAETDKPSLALVVEDDDKAADLLRLQLEAAGFRVLRVATGESALELAANEKPDLITLDVHLPGMNGWEFLARIKVEPELTGIPVVIISSAADRIRAISLGAAQVLQKPVGRADLLSALEATGFRTTRDVSRTVLVVDDDPKAVKMFDTFLDGAGYRVLSAFGGEDGIALALNERPDLIVLDLMMPEITGFDVVDALKKGPETASIPVIVVTAKQITIEDRERLNSEVLKIIEKSAFSPDHFISEVKQALTEKDK
ncbi:response regulator [Telmatospirillum sp.]|uniref:response regulator n=1 Tax=Telmatospirillum sp. TaxID=2079197 RepID=UPI00284C8235|nr:response regulator [Telmatospirillum sp.]MDR3436013.1 response regulator [Telmatospirillum sp.]